MAGTLIYTTCQAVKGSESDIESSALTLYKLIILFILDKVDFPLTNAQISNLILEKGYTNYFTIQQAINELESSELIEGETIRNSSYFQITSAGHETLSFFNKEISDAIKEEILAYLKDNKYELREEVSTVSDYYESKKGEYIAHCYVKELNSKVIEISLSVPTEEEAIEICNHWKDKSQKIYAFLMKELMF